jgi:hypothetical protein
MLSTLSSCVVASNCCFSNSHSFVVATNLSTRRRLELLPAPLSGHGIKREDDEKYAAQGPPKQSRCLLFSHKSTTMELNKCSEQLFFSQKCVGETGGTGTNRYPLSFLEKIARDFPVPRARSRSARTAKQASPCLAPPTHQGGAVQEPGSRRYRCGYGSCYCVGRL